MNFTVGAIPQLVDDILQQANLQKDDIDIYIFHQATRKLLEQLQERLELDDSKLPIVLENCGNTVSATIPLLIDHLRSNGCLNPGTPSMLVGFGVGWSWAGCIWKETWSV